MKNILNILAILFVVFDATSQPLSIDQSFDLNFDFYGGYLSKGRLASHIRLANGDFIVSGSFNFTKNNKTYGDILRLSQNGILDESFNNLVTSDGPGTIINRQDSFFAIGSLWCLFYNLSGEILYNSWHNNFHSDLSDDIEDIEFFDNNSSLISGCNMVYYPDTTHQTRFNLVRLNPDGHVDTTFNHDTNDCVWDIVKYDSSRVFLVGKFTKYDSTNISSLCRIYNDGTLDTTFRTTIIWGTALPLYIQNDGKIIVGRSFWLEGDSIGSGVNWNPRVLIRLMPDGSIDSTFNNTCFSGITNAQTNVICPTYDGGYLVGGMFTHFNGYPRGCIAKIDANGYLDSTAFNGSGFDTVMTTNKRSWIRILAQGPNETYYVGGNFDRFNGETVQPLVRLHNEFYGLDIQERQEKGIEIFPNPTNETLSINSVSCIEEIEVYSLTGYLLRQVPVYSNRKTIDVSDLNPGNYILRAIGNNEVWVEKFVVMR